MKETAAAKRATRRNVLHKKHESSLKISNVPIAYLKGARMLPNLLYLIRSILL